MARNDGQQQSVQILDDVKQEPLPPFVPVISLNYCYDGIHLLIGYGNVAYLWDVETGKELQQFQGHAEHVLAVAFSPDRKQVLTGAGGGGDRPSKDDSTRLWNLATGQGIWRYNDECLVETVQFSPDGKRVLTASSSGKARILDGVTGQEVFAFSNVHSVFQPSPVAVFSPDGRSVLGIRSHQVTLWDAQTGKVLVTIKNGKKKLIPSAMFNPNGTIVLTALWDGTARTWDAETGRELKVFRGHTSDYVNQAIFTADGHTVVTASSDKTVRLWNANTGKEMRRIQYPGDVRQVLINRDGTRLFAQWDAHNPWRLGITLSDAESGREIRTFKCGEIVGFSPDGTKFPVVGDGKLLSLWDAKTGKMIREYKR